jgi:hypothetical protein
MAVTGLLPILILAALILLFGARLLVQRSAGDNSRVVTIEDYTAAHAALDSVFVETAAIRRIFATDDIEFISQTGSRAVQRFFLKERKRLAVEWLRGTQKQVAHLMNLHLKLASYTYEPSPRFEFNLSVRYLCFILAANGLLVLLYLFGPFQASQIASYTMRSAEHFCSVLSMRLDKVDSVKLGSAH